ncbi:MAG TPA: hypothetical protein VKA77_07565, partial [Mycobacterium sp.]|nr:hypothetical protein [Mycobacterium sp.]
FRPKACTECREHLLGIAPEIKDVIGCNEVDRREFAQSRDLAMHQRQSSSVRGAPVPLSRLREHLSRMVDAPHIRLREPPQHLFEADARAGADLNDPTRRLFQVVLELKHCPPTEIRVGACHAAAHQPAKEASRIPKLSRNKSQHSAVSRSW